MLRRLAASRRPTAAAGAGPALVRRARAAAAAGSGAAAAVAAVVRATGARLASTLVVPPQYTGIETITRSEVGETMTRERLQNMIANPPRPRRVQLAEKGVAHGRGGRKHTVANVWIRALNPLDSPYVCKDMLSAKHPGVCQRMAAGTPCYFEHPSAEQIAQGAERVRNGTGNDILVNAQPYHEYFRRWAHRGDVTSPLLLTSMLGRFKVNATVKGGGLTGQAQAVRHGLARALQAYNPLLRPALKLAGLLRRDDRVVERKKWGQKKARKKFTWVKR